MPARKALELAVVPRQCDGSATLDNPIGPPCHTGSRYNVQLVFPSRSARRVLTHQPAPPTRAKHVATPRRTEHLRPDSQASRIVRVAPGYSGPAFMTSRVLVPSGSTTTGPSS